ncbi:hypothetical protein C8F01DRAFT_1234071 [Mycena amicta]|nr:hypothetical protein C8F01DRAFT_1234071 [Mycena amicta]
MQGELHWAHGRGDQDRVDNSHYIEVWALCLYRFRDNASSCEVVARDIDFIEAFQRIEAVRNAIAVDGMLCGEVVVEEEIKASLCSDPSDVSDADAPLRPSTESTAWRPSLHDCGSPTPIASFSPATLLITDLVAFKLPPQNVSTVYTDAEDYLSEDAPTVVECDAQAIPAPPAPVIKALGRHLLDNPGVKSIRLLHAPTFRGPAKSYPLFLVTLWAQLEEVREVKKTWQRALEKLEEEERRVANDGAGTMLVQDVFSALGEIAWKGEIKGFIDAKSTRYLACWLTTDWLATTHEHQLLEILQRDLRMGPTSTDMLQDTFFTPALITAFHNSDRYSSSRNYSWLRGIGQAFATGDLARFATIANINENHWIALAIDVEQKAIFCGNSILMDVPKRFKEAYTWWLREHLGESFEWKDLPVPQQSDSHSCGILAYRAIAHFLDTVQYPLPRGTAREMAHERLKMLIRVVKRHKQQTQDDIHKRPKPAAFDKTASGFQFTFRHQMQLETTDDYEQRDGDEDDSASEFGEDDDNSGSEFEEDDQNDSEDDVGPSAGQTASDLGRNDSDVPSPPHSRSSPPTLSRKRSFDSIDDDAADFGADTNPRSRTPSPLPDRPVTPKRPLKRSFTERTTGTPHGSPQKKKQGTGKLKRVSATAQALADAKDGKTTASPLFSFFEPKALAEEEKAQVYAALGDERRELAEARKMNADEMKALNDQRRKAGQNARQKAIIAAPTLTELCVMALHQQAITHPYMAIVRAPEDAALNAIDLGPLHDDVQAHCAALIEDPDLLLDFDADCHIHGTLDGKQFTRLEVVEAVKKLSEAGDVPHLREIFIAFLRGAQETWIRFSSEFAPGGVIDGLSPSLRKHVYLNPTNDVNEGALGEFCVRKRQKETLTITVNNGLSMHKRNETSKFVDAFFEAEDHVWVMREARKYQAEGHEKKWRMEQAEFEVKMVAMKRERRAVRQEKDRLKAVVVDATELVTDDEKLGKMTGKQMNLQIDKLRAIWGKKFKLPTKSLRVKDRMAALKESVKEHLKRLEEAGGKVPSDDPGEEVVLVVDAWKKKTRRWRMSDGDDVFGYLAFRHTF